jgi:hypothetical protein
MDVNIWSRYHPSTVLWSLSDEILWPHSVESSSYFVALNRLRTKITLPLLHFILYYNRPPLWSSGQSSWLQIQWPGFDSLRYQIFWEVVSLEWGPLGLVNATEELLGRNSSGFGLESREYCRRDPSRWPRGIYPQKKKLALTSLTSGGRSVGIVRLRTEATVVKSPVMLNLL